MRSNSGIAAIRSFTVCRSLGHLLLQPPDLVFDQIGHPLLGEVNLFYGHAEPRRDFFRRPVLVHIEVEDLIFLRVNVALHSGDGGIEQVLLPFAVPEVIEGMTRRIDHAIDGPGASAAVSGYRARLSERPAFANLINDAP